MTDAEKEKAEIIDLLCFQTGKAEWWFEDLTLKELMNMYDKLNAIYE